MTFVRSDPNEEALNPPRLPSWALRGAADTLDDVAFLSGAALGALHLLVADRALPQTLLRDRLALGAAEACVAWQGRPERAAELRDAVHLARPGDALGPAGEVLAVWRRVVARPASTRSLARALPNVTSEAIEDWMTTGQGGPVARAAGVLEAVLADRPRDEVTALALAEATLSRALGWSHVTPVITAALPSRALRRTGEDLRLACHRAARAGAGRVAQQAVELGRAGARLEAVAPKLRAKGAGQAVALFFENDALAPAALTHLMSDRAARRLCDRLVALGAVRELTGRDTFRLYGV
ncbi:DUF1403 family protein [Maritimibacter sp. DP07]|uniref:DUF1403 family protein n=1 Tax=Maritimibacter harenae TaxID=2606218 RepID=A0A845M888_9RHOB|nr:DUF1403 family protein [Maritimibacter harenae]MZR13763.1 DUF1403 family protein [Maritimibacter harenae]